MNWINLFSEALSDLLSDKNLVIISLVILGLAILNVDELTQLQSQLMNSIISGLLGIAVGRRFPSIPIQGSKKK